MVKITAELSLGSIISQKMSQFGVFILFVLAYLFVLPLVYWYVQVFCVVPVPSHLCFLPVQFVSVPAHSFPQLCLACHTPAVLIYDSLHLVHVFLCVSSVRSSYVPLYCFVHHLQLLVLFLLNKFCIFGSDQPTCHLLVCILGSSLKTNQHCYRRNCKCLTNASNTVGIFAPQL